MKLCMLSTVDYSRLCLNLNLELLAPPVNLIEPPPVETRTAAYGMTVVMDCRTDLEPPVKYMWYKQGGELPRDAKGEMEVSFLFLSNSIIVSPYLL